MLGDFFVILPRNRVSMVARLLLSFMAKKSKTFNSEINGKRDSFIDEANKVEAIMGSGKSNPYGVQSLAELEESLSSMTTTDLQNLCIKNGVTAMGTNAQIKERLRKDFKQKIKSYNFAPMEIDVGIDHSKHKEYKKVMDYLRM